MFWKSLFFGRTIGFMLGDQNKFVGVIVVELLACFMEKMEWMWRSGFEIDSWNSLECLSY